MFAHLLGFPLLAATHKIGLDWFESPRYSISISTTKPLQTLISNISKDRIVSIENMITCVLPPNPSHSTHQYPLPLHAAVPNISESEIILDSLSEMGCLTYYSGYWTYLFCHEKSLIQYHTDSVTNIIDENTKFILGTYHKLAAQSVARLDADETYIAEDSDAQKVFRQVWGGGAACDILDGKSRVTSIEYRCKARETVISIKETGTCVYEIVIGTDRLCDVAGFEPRKIKNDDLIECVLRDMDVFKLKQKKKAASAAKKQKPEETGKMLTFLEYVDRISGGDNEVRVPVTRARAVEDDKHKKLQSLLKSYVERIFGDVEVVVIEE